jgi:hypothetical protein
VVTQEKSFRQAHIHPSDRMRGPRTHGRGDFGGFSGSANVFLDAFLETREERVVDAVYPHLRTGRGAEAVTEVRR